ncbi:phospholipase D-like domain-containing protein [Terracidiphilus gabretensis]|uniref:phospholipase D-like domain-containing protein n=1 Tax=Terracidiphilus gabretensis TaxID=1577687 RepID=UPI00071B5410|nr:phospholipase D-like domain-containing protein [Terracidiphilus gabretensis]
MATKSTKEPEHKKPVHKKPEPKPKPAPANATTYTLITMPDDGPKGPTAIYDLLSSAKKTIDMTMYELTDTQVTSILTKAASSGVTVRVILDQNNEKKSNTTAFNALTKGGVSVHWANPVYAVTHQKTITVDSATSAIMTLNLVTEDYPTTRDFAVITNDAKDISAIETTFAADFTNAAITPPTGDNLAWSPTNSRTAILGVINGATKSLYIAQEEMSDAGVESAIEAALKRGVSVTLVQENMTGSYTAVLQAFKSDGAKVATYSSRTGYYIHAKAFLADYNTPQATLFLGSENCTAASLNSNRELGLIFSDPACMTGVYNAIMSDFNGGTQSLIVPANFVKPVIH